jgi:hypothetical protein
VQVGDEDERLHLVLQSAQFGDIGNPHFGGGLRRWLSIEPGQLSLTVRIAVRAVRSIALLGLVPALASPDTSAGERKAQLCLLPPAPAMSAVAFRDPVIGAEGPGG